MCNNIKQIINRTKNKRKHENNSILIEDYVMESNQRVKYNSYDELTLRQQKRRIKEITEMIVSQCFPKEDDSTLVRNVDITKKWIQ